ncbi:hypothetical protein [Pseudomonas sp. PWP3-1b2]|uniref:hypothetical protein n=1 Tax=Pseudomonas sp. PWP3-1b2 TaxID=2804656 RepID=UPI003CF60B82
MSGAYLGSVIKGEEAKYSLLGSVLGTAIGYKSGSVITGQLKLLIGNTASETSGVATGSVLSEIVSGGVSNMGSNK